MVEDELSAPAERHAVPLPVVIGNYGGGVHLTAAHDRLDGRSFCLVASYLPVHSLVALLVLAVRPFVCFQILFIRY